MAEFIIVFPILFLAIIGIIEFGRAVMIQQVLTNAAREGARRAVVPEATNEDVTTLVTNYLNNTSIATPNQEIYILDEAGALLDLSTAPPHSLVEVRVIVPYNDVGFGIYAYFRDSTMGSLVRMRKE